MSFNIGSYNNIKSKDRIVIKRDKSTYQPNVNRYSERDNKVNFDQKDYQNRVNTFLNERGNMFNIDTQKKHYKADKLPDYGSGFINSQNVGEITGTKLDNNNMEPGMPMRQYLDNQLMSSQKDTSKDYNPYLDFDLYDSKLKTNVSYFDPSNGPTSNSNFSNINANGPLLPPISGVANDTTMAGIINSFSTKFLKIFQNLLKHNLKIVISPFSILLILLSLYKGSKSMTEQELKKILNLPGKNIIFQPFDILLNNLDGSDLMVSNFIFISNENSLNRPFVNAVKRFTYVGQFNTTEPYNEANKINHMIKNFTQNKMNLKIDPNLITYDNKIILLSSMYYYSRWKYMFPKSMSNIDIFFGKKKRQIEYIANEKLPIRYYEDSAYTVCEIDYFRDEFTMGIVLPKKNTGLSLNHEQYEYYVSNLKMIIVNKIKIPKINHHCKFKISNALKIMKFNNIFTNADLSDIIPMNNKININYIIHTTNFRIDETGMEDINHHTKSSNINFVANHPFIYYLRYKPKNCLILMGSFY